MRTRLWRILLGVWVLVISLFVSIPQASAHSDDTFWFAEWRSQDRGTSNQWYEYTSQVPGGATGAFADRVANAAQGWNAIAINGSDMTFLRNGATGNYDPFASCGSIPHYKNGIHYRNIPDNSRAYGRVCITQVTPGTDLINSFQIIYDPSYTWYTGVNYNQIPSNQDDVQGVGAHEFGHVMSGWTASTPGYHFDYGANPNLCYPGVPHTGHHTMCNYPGSGLPSSLQRTLEAHDIDTIQLAYA